MTVRPRFMTGASAVSLAALSLFAAMPAMAQADQAADDQAEEEAPRSDIVVTGSRIQASGFSAPTPVTVVTAEQLAIAQPNSIGDALNQLPVFRHS